jgi:S1-C subfamily serine protease
VGGSDVTDLRSVIDPVRQAKPGSKLEFHIRRDGKEKDVTVKVGILPFAFLVRLE